MHSETIVYYNKNADKLAIRYDSADVGSLHNFLHRWLSNSGEVLEIGCGSGRDSKYIASLGCKVLATDASDNFIQYASSGVAGHHESPISNPQFIQKTFPLPNNDPLLKRQFDAVVFIAVLMHIHDCDLFELIYQIRGMLRKNGIFICSMCTDHESAPNDTRLYRNREPSEIQLLLERIGFRLLATEKNRDGLGRPTIWTTMVFQLEGGTGTRPIDQIESIINRDSKTATYKIALLRALGEIAQHSYNHAQWHPEDVVSIPLGLIVEKWIYYYWPLIDSPYDLPEMRCGVRAKGIAFRPLMMELISSFSQGGMDAFSALFNGGNLSDIQSDLVARVSSVIAKTIVKGPVTYSGGSLEGVDRVFEFKGKMNLSSCRTPMDLVNGMGCVYFPASLWREMCLIGHWISEAIILRWAGLSRNFSKQKIELSHILERLLIRPSEEREVAKARAIYKNTDVLECVWSARKLRMNRFDVDHVIPFSLWHNNDLWNLLPADPKVNNSKRDKIVTHQTLLESKDRIIHYWKMVYQEEPVRFSTAVSRTLSKGNFSNNNWEIQTFAALNEAVETVALQRGVERWPYN